MKKVCDENEKQCMRKNIMDGRKAFKGQVWKTYAMDINELQVDDY